MIFLNGFSKWVCGATQTFKCLWIVKARVEAQYYCEVACKMFANVANESCLRGSQQTMQSYRYYESDTTIFLMSYQMKWRQKQCLALTHLCLWPMASHISQTVWIRQCIYSLHVRYWYFHATLISTWKLSFCPICQSEDFMNMYFKKQILGIGLSWK